MQGRGAKDRPGMGSSEGRNASSTKNSSLIFGDSNRKCCMMHVKKRKREHLARVSPMQLRLPTNDLKV